MLSGILLTRVRLLKLGLRRKVCHLGNWWSVVGRRESQGAFDVKRTGGCRLQLLLGYRNARGEREQRRKEGARRAGGWTIYLWLLVGGKGAMTGPRPRHVRRQRKRRYGGGPPAPDTDAAKTSGCSSLQACASRSSVSQAGCVRLDESDQDRRRSRLHIHTRGLPVRDEWPLSWRGF